MKLQAIATNKGFAICPQDQERYRRFKRGEQFEVEVKQGRNPQFHRKAFAFLNFCFHYWRGDRAFLCDAAQFDEFRKEITVVAGYYDEVWSITGELTVVAKSLSYQSMEQEQFEQLYSAWIDAAMLHIFKGADDITVNTLMEFF